MSDSNQNTRSFDGEINRRSFIGAASAVSIGRIDSVNALLAELEPKAETQFIEAALEFELLDDGITPGEREGPYRYNAVRDESVLFALNRLDSGIFDKMLTAETVTFGLNSFETGTATFAKDGLNVLPTLASDTPRVTKYFQLDQWDGAPTYSVRSSGNDATIVEVADEQIEIPGDTAQRIELDEREIPPDRIPGYDESDEVRVAPRLEVRNYGRMEVYDARDEAWKR